MAQFVHRKLWVIQGLVSEYIIYFVYDFILRLGETNVLKSDKTICLGAHESLFKSR